MRPNFGKGERMTLDRFPSMAPHGFGSDNLDPRTDEDGNEVEEPPTAGHPGMREYDPKRRQVFHMTSLKPSDRLAEICTVVCDEMGVPLEIVMGKSRPAYVVKVRWACIFCAWTYTELIIGQRDSFGCLARYFRLEAATIRHALRCLKDHLSGQTGHTEFAEAILKLTTEFERMGFKVRRKL